MTHCAACVSLRGTVCLASIVSTCARMSRAYLTKSIMNRRRCIDLECSYTIPFRRSSPAYSYRFDHIRSRCLWCEYVVRSIDVIIIVVVIVVITRQPSASNTVNPVDEVLTSRPTMRGGMVLARVSRLVVHAPSPSIHTKRSRVLLLLLLMQRYLGKICSTCRTHCGVRVRV